MRGDKTVLELKTSGLLPFYLRHYSRCTDCLRFPPGYPNNDRNTGGNTGLQLAQNCPAYQGILITGGYCTTMDRVAQSV